MLNSKYDAILRNFHASCNLNLYVVNQNNKTIARYTTPLAPKLSNKLIESSRITSNLNIYLITNQSSLGIFKLDNLRIIGWNPNFTISGKGGYLRKAPMLEYNEFSHMMSCLYFMIYQKWPRINNKQTNIKIGESISTVSSTSVSYEGYLAEKELMDAVTNGNLSQFNQRFVTFIKKGNFGSFGQEKNRDAKDMAIAATTLYTRAAIAGGLSVAEAYGLSDHIISQIEKDQAILNYYEYSRAIGEIFINRVIRTTRKDLTSPVYKAQEYIYANFRSISNVNEIAQQINISTSYLQHLFKKETGQSLIQFITKQKVKQAKHDLIFTKNSIEEIAYDLGFNNQGQLSNVFKKVTGMTPITFRKQYA